MEARPLSPASVERPWHVVTPRHPVAPLCSEQKEFNVTLPPRHLSTRQMFRFANDVRLRRRGTKAARLRRKRMKRHLGRCSQCLKDFTAIADLLIKSQLAKTAEKTAEKRAEKRAQSPPVRLEGICQGPPAQLLAVFSLQPRLRTSPADLQREESLSLSYCRDGKMRVGVRASRAAFRLEFSHSRLPSGTMLRIQYESPGRQRTIRSHYAVLTAEEERSRGGLLLYYEEFARQNRPLEIVVEFVASASILHETDATSLWQSFERAISARASNPAERIAVQAAWREWAGQTAAERGIDPAIHSLAREIFASR